MQSELRLWVCRERVATAWESFPYVNRETPLPAPLRATLLLGYCRVL